MLRIFILVMATMAVGPAFAQAGGMSLADFQKAGRTRLMQADSDRDGRIAKAEWTARPHAGANAKADPGTLFDRLDTNHDGALGQAELDTLLARRFERIDADGDGTMTAKERRAARERVDD